MSDITLSPLIVPPTPATGYLMIETGSLAGQRFALPAAPGALLLGREQICNVRFDPERDRVVGRTHARIEVRMDGIYLTDLNSANGTFRADGTAVRGEVRLHPEERFLLGGEGGPWLALKPAPAAVHTAPPRPDAPTVITRTAPPAQVQEAATFAPAIHATAPHIAKKPRAESSVESAKRQPPALEPEARQEVTRPRVEPEAVDPSVLRQRRQYQRQIVLIVLLLLVSCGLGLGIGLHDGPADSDEESVRAE